MAKRVVSLSALNIKTHPHEPSKYVELLSNTFRESRVVKIRGHDYGMIGSMYNLERDNPLEGIHGTIFRFLNIIFNSPETKFVSANVVLGIFLFPDFLLS